jgi:hypothetical protein
MSSYILHPRIPRRAFALGLVGTLAGLVLVVVGLLQAWSIVWVVLSAVLLAFGLLALIMVSYSLSNHRVRIDLDDKGYRVHGPEMDRRGTWAKVTQVALTPDGSRLMIASGPVKRTYISCPKGGDDPAMKALVGEIRTHLPKN